MPNLGAVLADGAYLREQAKQEAAELEADWVKRHSCQFKIPGIPSRKILCGESADHCQTCDWCGRPFCEKHGAMQDGVFLCAPCEEITE